jgi:hypothetical protein
MEELIILCVVGAGVALAIFADRLGKRLAGKSRTLQPYFHRLSQIAPHQPCPCKESRGIPRAYQDCCRPRDVELLEKYTKEFTWSDWMRKSSGRKRAGSMKHRLEDYPMAEPVLPEWVTSPEKYEFPIPEETVRAWTPLTDAQQAGAAAEVGGDLPL